MKIVCPSCFAVYQVPEELLARRQTLKCSACGQTWRLSQPEQDTAAAVVAPEDVAGHHPAHEHEVEAPVAAAPVVDPIAADQPPESTADVPAEAQLVAESVAAQAEVPAHVEDTSEPVPPPSEPPLEVAEADVQAPPEAPPAASEGATESPDAEPAPIPQPQDHGDEGASLPAAHAADTVPTEPQAEAVVAPPESHVVADDGPSSELQVADTLPHAENEGQPHEEVPESPQAAELSVPDSVEQPPVDQTHTENVPEAVPVVVEEAAVPAEHGAPAIVPVAEGVPVAAGQAVVVQAETALAVAPPVASGTDVAVSAGGKTLAPSYRIPPAPVAALGADAPSLEAQRAIGAGVPAYRSSGGGLRAILLAPAFWRVAWCASVIVCLGVVYLVWGHWTAVVRAWPAAARLHIPG